jgi:hypothetical protein
MKSLFSAMFLMGILHFLSCQQVGAALQAHVTVDNITTSFTYTVFNDEPTSSNSYLDAFHLVVNAPFDVVSSPDGWTFLTDNLTYIDWFNTNTNVPHTNDIAPASFKGGFVIRSHLPPDLPSGSDSLMFALSSWDYATTNSGPTAIGSAVAPSVTSVSAVLSNPLFSSGVFTFTLVGIPSYIYIIESSTNLAAWSAFSTNPVPSKLVLTNSSGLPSQFYRADVAPNSAGFGPD